MDSSYNKRQSVKLGQVIQNFFGKAVQIVLQSRVPSSWNEGEENKVNKWFNLYLPTLSTSAKEDLRLWKIQPQATTSSSVTSSSSDVASLPPMIIETYLDLRKLGPRQTVVLKDDTGNPWTVAKGGAKKQEVVLERWLIEFDPLEVSGFNVDELPFIYKQAIVLFRSLYAFTRLMPAYKLYRNLNQQSQLTSSLSIGIKVLDGKQPISSKGRVGLSKSIIPHQMLVTESHMQQKHFSPIQTTMGTLKVSIAYRTHHNFCVHDSEEILSTHFISIDKTDDKKKRVSIASMSVSPKQLSQSQSHLLTPMLLLPLTHLQLLLHLLRESHSHPHSHSHSYQSQGSTGSGGGSGGGSTPGASAPVAGSSIPVTPLRPSIQPFKIGSISNSPCFVIVGKTYFNNQQ